MATGSSAFSCAVGDSEWKKTDRILLQILQGLAPPLIASLSDEAGRRPSYIICFVLYIAANIGLACQSSFAALFVLRCLQSSGSSGTVSLVQAVAADVATTAERGTYMSYASMGTLLGPTVGPIIGGLLVQFLGWRSIFWFLTIFAGCAFIVFLVFFPETCRNVVGNGSVPPQRWNVSVLTYMKQRKLNKADLRSQRRSVRLTKASNPLQSLRIVADPESGLILFYSAILFCGFYCVTAALPFQLQDIYGFNSLQIGLCYIPVGCGSLTAVIVTGRAIDWNFRRHAKRLGIEVAKGRQSDLRNYPLELARIQVAIPFTILEIVGLILFGWVTGLRTTLAGPLILLYFLGFASSAAWTSFNTLNVDLNRKSPAAATAANNLVRCLLGAGAVAAVVPCLGRIGSGWTYTLIAFICILFSPIMWVVVHSGPKWREGKRVKAEKAEEAEKLKSESSQETLKG